MPLVSRVYSFVATFISSMIVPTSDIGIGSLGFSHFFKSIWETICNGFYSVCKWFLAFMDFLQYFIQKLIGLDYWLDASLDGNRTLGKATSEDMIFKFLYADSVQKVFRALCALFIILLIVFTIFQIIKSEWDFMTGDGKNGNSKNAIFRSSFKAILLVLIFPIVLVMGIVSSNAILASIIKAVGVDMAETFGGKIFSIAAQPANKYRHYVDAGAYLPTTDQVTFYLDDSNKVIYFGQEEKSNQFREYYPMYTDYLTEISKARKLTINSIFDPLIPKNEESFSGYCFQVKDDDGKVQNYFVKAESAEKDKYYYYLVGCLGANVYGDGVNDGEFNSSLDAKTLAALEEDVGGSTKGLGYIQNLDLSDARAITRNICRNSWNYSLIYISPNKKLSQSLAGTGNQPLDRFGLGSSVGMILHNSEHISGYFDGGQFGVVQSRAEYQVMSDVVDFMCDNNLTFYIMDATSPLIEWNYDGYHIDSSLISANMKSGIGTGSSSVRLNSESKLQTIISDEASTPDVDESVKALTFLTNYANNNTLPAENEQEVIYIAKYGAQSELDGARYIVCLSDGATYYPLVNGREFSVGDREYVFSSSTYDKNYHGVVWAKGTFDTRTVDASRGNPTYLKNTSTFSGETETVADSDGSYYYRFSGTEIKFFTHYTQTVGGTNYAFNPSGSGNMYYGNVETLYNSSSYANKTLTINSKTYNLQKTGRVVNGYIEYATEKTGICYVVYDNGSALQQLNSGGTYSAVGPTLKASYLTSAGAKLLGSDLAIKSVSFTSLHYGEDATNTLKSAFSVFDDTGATDANGDPVYEYLGSFTKTSVDKTVASLSNIKDNTRTFKPNWGGEYYNIDVVGVASDQNEIKEKFGAMTIADSVSCCRNQIETFSGSSLFDYIIEINIKLFKGIWEVKTGCVKQVSDTASIQAGNTFAFAGAGSGITFDYFFDQNVKLKTFYSASKINYPLLLVASIMIIKVLFSSLWGVIKRFYMITLYYLAMPVAASTMPIDGGSRFGNIRNQITQEVLSTYGVLIGLNLFFVLLSPIDEISRTIFTDEAIANSGSYFLIKLSDWLSARVLNELVYILFLLVAFTLINELPQFISNLSGGKDLKASGEQTQGAAKGALSAAKNVVNGGFIKDMYGEAKKTVPFVQGAENVVKAGVKGVGKVGEAFKKGYDKVKNGKGEKGEGGEGQEAEKKNSRQGEDGEDQGAENQNSRQEQEVDENGNPIEMENSRPNVDEDGNPLGDEADENGDAEDQEMDEELKKKAESLDGLDEEEYEALSDDDKEKYDNAHEKFIENTINGKKKLTADEFDKLSEKDQNKYARNRAKQERFAKQRAKFLGYEFDVETGKYKTGKQDDDGNDIELDEEAVNQELQNMGVTQQEKGLGMTFKQHDGKKISKLRMFKAGAGKAKAEKRNARAMAKAEFANLDYDAATGTYKDKTSGEEISEENVNKYLNAYGVKTGVFSGKVRAKAFHFTAAARMKKAKNADGSFDFSKVKDPKDKHRGFSFDMASGEFTKVDKNGNVVNLGKTLTKAHVSNVGHGIKSGVSAVTNWADAKVKKGLNSHLSRRKAKFAGYKYDSKTDTYTDKDGKTITQDEMNEELNSMGVTQGKLGGFKQHGKRVLAGKWLGLGGTKAAERRNNRARAKAKFANLKYDAATGTYKTGKKDKNGEEITVSEENVNKYLNSYGVKTGVFSGKIKAKAFHLTAASRLKKGGESSLKNIKDRKRNFSFDMETGEFTKKDSSGNTISLGKTLVGSHFKKGHVTHLAKRKALFAGYTYNKVTQKYEKVNEKGKKVSIKENEMNEELKNLGVTQGKLGGFKQHGKRIFAHKWLGYGGTEGARERNSLAEKRAKFLKLDDYKYDARSNTYRKYDDKGNVVDTKSDADINKMLNDKGIRQRKVFNRGSMTGRGIGNFQTFTDMKQASKYQMNAKLNAARWSLGKLAYDSKSGLVMTKNMAAKRNGEPVVKNERFKNFIKNNPGIQKLTTTFNKVVEDVKSPERVKAVKTTLAKAGKGLKTAGLVAGAVAMSATPLGIVGTGLVYGTAYLSKKAVQEGVKFAKADKDTRIQMAKHWGGNALKVAAVAGVGFVSGPMVGAIAGANVLAWSKFKAVRTRNNAKVAQNAGFATGGNAGTSGTPASQGVDVTAPQTVQQTQNAFVYDESKIAEIVRKVLRGEEMFASQGERVEATAHTVNYGAINDERFVSDKTNAYRNTIVNSIGAGSGAGTAIIANVVNNYAQNAGVSLNEVLFGDGKENAGMISAETKLAMYKSIMTTEQLDNLKKKDADEKNWTAEQFVKFIEDKSTSGLGLSLEAVQGKNGIEFEFVDRNGSRKLVQGEGDKDNAVNNALREVMNSDKITDDAVVESIERTGNMERVEKAIARNYALTIDYNTETTGKISGSAYHQEVFDRAVKNEDINAEAIYLYLQNNPEKFDEFKQDFHIKGDEANAQELIMEAIKSSVKNKSGVIGNLAPETYGKELSAVVSKRVANNSFKVEAFDMLSKPDQMELTDHISANMEAASTGVSHAYTTAERATKVKLAEGAMGDVEMVNAFLNSNIENKDAIINEMIKNHLGVDKAESVQGKAVLSKIGTAKLAQLRKANYTDEEIIVAYGKAKILGQEKNLESFIRNNSSDRQIVESLMRGKAVTEVSMEDTAKFDQYTEIANKTFEAQATLKAVEFKIANAKATGDTTVNLAHLEEIRANAKANLDALEQQRKSSYTSLGIASNSANIVRQRELIEKFRTEVLSNPENSEQALAQFMQNGTEYERFATEMFKGAKLNIDERQKMDSKQMISKLSTSVTSYSKTVETSAGGSQIVSSKPLTNNQFVSVVLSQEPAKANDTINRLVLDSMGIKNSAGKIDVKSDAYLAMIEEIKLNDKWKKNFDHIKDYTSVDAQNLVLGYAKAKVLGEENENKSGSFIGRVSEARNADIAKKLSELSSRESTGESIVAGTLSVESAKLAVDNLKLEYLTGDRQVSKLNASIQGYYRASNILDFLKKNVSDDDMSKLRKDGAENGFYTLTMAEQNGLLAKLALKDEGAVKILKKNNVNLNSQMEVSNFLNTSQGEALRERLISKASHEMTALDMFAERLGVSSAGVYGLVYKQNKNTERDALYEKYQGEIIPLERVKEAAAENGKLKSVVSITDNAVDRIKLLTTEEEIYYSAKARKTGKVEEVEALLAQDTKYQKLTRIEQIQKVVEELKAKGIVSSDDKLAQDKITANANAMAGNGLARQTAVSNTVWDDADMKNNARNLYRNLYKGELNNINELDRNSFIMQHLSDILKMSKGKAYYDKINDVLSQFELKPETTATPGKIIENLSQEQFNTVVKGMKVDGEKAVSELRGKVIEKSGKTEEFTEIPDPSKMTATELKDYNAKKSALEQEYRKNNDSETFVNLYKNTTLVNENETLTEILSKINTNIGEARKEALRNNGDYMGSLRDSLLGSDQYSKMLAEIKSHLKLEGVDYDKLSNEDKNEYIKQLLSSEAFLNKSPEAKKLAKAYEDSVEAELAKRAGTATNTEVKQGLPPELISKFLASNVATRDQLIKIGARKHEHMFNPMKYYYAITHMMMNDYTLRMRFVRMMLRNLYREPELQRMVEDEVYKQRPELKNQSRAEAKKYLDANRAELERLLGERLLLQKDKKGNFVLNKEVVNQPMANKVIKDMEYREPKLGDIARKALGEAVKTMLGINDKKDPKTDELLSKLNGKLEGSAEFKKIVKEVVKPTMREQFQTYLNGAEWENIISKTKRDLRTDTEFARAIFEKANAANSQEVGRLQKLLNTLRGKNKN